MVVTSDALITMFIVTDCRKMGIPVTEMASLKPEMLRLGLNAKIYGLGTGLVNITG